VIDPRVPSVSFFKLIGDAYQLADEARDDEPVTLTEPYALTLRATDLTNPH